MKSRIAKLVTAATIIIAVLVGIYVIGGSGASVAWAELVKRVEQSHDKYMQELSLAAKEKDGEKIVFCANLLSEFWQKLGWLAEARLNPELQIRMSAIIADKEAVYDKGEESDEIGIRIFRAHADRFNDWLGQIEDVTWINETVHVCKQLEEYAEEIRDGARDSEDGLAYIEHCMPSFLAYADWFKQLPWDDPSEHVGADKLLRVIERDLEISRREIRQLKIDGLDRFAKRSVEHAENNVLELGKRLQFKSTQNEKQRKLYKKLSRKVGEISDLLTYAIIAGWDIQQTERISPDEGFRQILRKEFGGRGPLGALLIEQIDESMDLCKKLLEELQSKQ